MYQQSLLQLTSSHDARALRAWARCQGCASGQQVRRVAGVMLLTPLPQLPDSHGCQALVLTV